MKKFSQGSILFIFTILLESINQLKNNKKKKKNLNLSSVFFSSGFYYFNR